MTGTWRLNNYAHFSYLNVFCSGKVAINFINIIQDNTHCWWFVILCWDQVVIDFTNIHQHYFTNTGAIITRVPVKQSLRM